MVFGLMEVDCANSRTEGSFSPSERAPVTMSCLILSFICSYMGLGLRISMIIMIIPPSAQSLSVKYNRCTNTYSTPIIPGLSSFCQGRGYPSTYLFPPAPPSYPGVGTESQDHSICGLLRLTRASIRGAQLRPAYPLSLRRKME